MLRCNSSKGPNAYMYVVKSLNMAMQMQLRLQVCPSPLVVKKARGVCLHKRDLGKMMIVIAAHPKIVLTTDKRVAIVGKSGGRPKDRECDLDVVEKSP